MTVNELIEKLEAIRDEHGSTTVMFRSHNNGEIYEAENLDIRVAEDGEFHDSWNMPEGFTFVEIE